MRFPSDLHYFASFTVCAIWTGLPGKEGAAAPI